MAPDWFLVFRQPIRSQVCSLTQFVTLTTTQKFPSQEKETFRKELLAAKEKIVSLESLINSVGINQSNQSEHSLEMERLSKQVNVNLSRLVKIIAKISIILDNFYSVFRSET